MPRLTNPTKYVSPLEDLDFTNYDKETLEDVKASLEVILREVANALSLADYRAELLALKKKYNIKD